MALLDELWSGVAFSSAPSIEREFALSHRGYVALVFVGPLLVASVLESAIALLSDAGGRRRLVLSGQAVLAVALGLTAWSRSPWGLSIGLAVAGASSGVACGAAQALLVSANPHDADRVMVRFTLFAAVGDVLTPLVAACAIALGHSYRSGLGAIAVVVAAQCAWMALHAAREPSGQTSRVSTPPSEPLRAALARAVRSYRLWAWLFAAAMCTLLDELVVALVALHLERDRGISEAFAAAAPLGFCAGAALGAALTDRVLVRMGRRAVLATSGLLCAVALAGVLARAPVLVSCLTLFLVGITCAPHHALAFAHAYEEMPNNPGCVQAIAQLFIVVDLIAPLALGLVADRFGLRAAIACLVLQPAVIVVCAVCIPRGVAR